MKPFLNFLSMAMLATVVSAFSRDGPPRETPGVPSRALSDVGKRAATTALVVALTLPFAEPAWAATYVSNSDVMSAISKLETNVNAKFDSVNNKFDSVNNKIDTAKNELGYVPALGFVVSAFTAGIGFAVSSYVSLESSKNSNQAVAEAKDQVKQGMQQGVQEVMSLLFVGAVVTAIYMFNSVKG
jgi:hypothetical protein